MKSELSAPLHIPLELLTSFSSSGFYDEMTDFTIRSGKQTFNCHKVIIAGNSPVLHAMVRSGMTEASSNQADIHTIPPAVMQLVLDYMYKGETGIPHEHLQQTIEAADYFTAAGVEGNLLG